MADGVLYISFSVPHPLIVRCPNIDISSSLFVYDLDVEKWIMIIKFFKRIRKLFKTVISKRCTELDVT